MIERMCVVYVCVLLCGYAYPCVYVPCDGFVWGSARARVSVRVGVRMCVLCVCVCVCFVGCFCVCV